MWDIHNTSRAVQVLCSEDTKEINSAMTHIQQQTLLEQHWKVKRHGQRWAQIPLCKHLNCSWGILVPHFLPPNTTPVTSQPLGAALEHEATGCFSGESSSPGEKQLPYHAGWRIIQLPGMFKCSFLLFVAREVIRTKPSKQKFILLIYLLFHLLTVVPYWDVSMAVVTSKPTKNLALALLWTL